jgi:hypothetical protein
LTSNASSFIIDRRCLLIRCFVFSSKLQCRDTTCDVDCTHEGMRRPLSTSVRAWPLLALDRYWPQSHYRPRLIQRCRAGVLVISRKVGQLCCDTDGCAGPCCCNRHLGQYHRRCTNQRSVLQPTLTSASRSTSSTVSQRLTATGASPLWRSSSEYL